MNFFGHAVVASWTDGSAEHALGSMLPDFEAMVRVRLNAVRDPDIERGIDLHHCTDDAFHRAPAFLSLNGQALDELTRAGVRRGTARAVAHISTEMFLDGYLARDSQHVNHYLAALQIDARAALDWGDGGAAYQALHERLARWSRPGDYGEPAFVLDRLRDALARRPALAVRPQDTGALAACLPALRGRVEQHARELLDQLRVALGFGD